MLKSRHLLALFLITLVFVVSAGALVSGRSQVQPEGTLVFPNLLGRINDVARVQINAAGKNFVIQGSDLGWHIPSQDNYRADANKVHKLLVGMSGLRRVEPKTHKPALYAALNLTDPGKKDSKAVGITLLDHGGDALAKLILGVGQPARADPSSEEYYVRLGSDPQSWLVTGLLPRAGSKVDDWLDKNIAQIGEPRLRQTRVTHADGEVVTAFRKTPKDRNFSYQELPAGRALADEWQMNDLGRFLENLDNHGMYAKARATAATPLLKAQMQTFDGLIVKLTAREKAGEVYAELSAAFEPATAKFPDPGKNDKLKTPDQVRAEVEQLNRRWHGWVYQLPKFKADYLKKRQAEFLKKQP